MKQSEQVLVSQTHQNEKCEISVFANQAPATPDQIEGFVKMLAGSFPNMQADFWAVVSMVVRRRKLSYERMLYIFDAVTGTHKYPTLTIADLMERDKVVKYLTYDEHYRKYGTTEASDGWEREIDEDGNLRYKKIIER